MKRLALWLSGLVAAVGLVLYDVDLFEHHLSDVQGNLEASVIWGTPTVLGFFVRSELRHRRSERVAQARHAERMADQAALHAKVDALLGAQPPATD